MLRVGPARFLVADSGLGYSMGASASKDGRVLAVPQGALTVVLHRDRPDRRILLRPQFNVRFSAVSPDGKWVVTGNHWGDGRSKSVQIWDAETGLQIRDLPLEGSTMMNFSADGKRQLTVGGPDTRLWEVGAWREVRRLNGWGGAFSPDGRLLAIGKSNSEIRLEETTTGREVACLTGPEQIWYGAVCLHRTDRGSSQGGGFIHV